MTSDICNTLLKCISPVQIILLISINSYEMLLMIHKELLAGLRSGFSNLCQRKFRNGFRDILNPLCPCSIEVETTTHYFLRCHFYNTHRSALMN